MLSHKVISVDFDLSQGDLWNGITNKNYVPQEDKVSNLQSLVLGS